MAPCSALTQIKCGMKEAMQKVLEYINTHLEEPLGAEKLAAEACLSPWPLLV